MATLEENSDLKEAALQMLLLRSTAPSKKNGDVSKPIQSQFRPVESDTEESNVDSRSEISENTTPSPFPSEQEQTVPVSYHHHPRILKHNVASKIFSRVIPYDLSSSNRQMRKKIAAAPERNQNDQVVEEAQKQVSPINSLLTKTNILEKEPLPLPLRGKVQSLLQNKRSPTNQLQSNRVNVGPGKGFLQIAPMRLHPQFEMHLKMNAAISMAPHHVVPANANMQLPLVQVLPYPHLQNIAIPMIPVHPSLHLPPQYKHQNIGGVRLYPRVYQKSIQ